MTEPALYRVEFDPRAWDEITALPEKAQLRLFDATDALEASPRPPGAVKLKGGSDLHRIRIGNYRIIYTIDDDVLSVLVVKVGDRKEVYRRR